MLSDIRVGAAWWTAKLGDGSEWSDLSPELQRGDRSPWRALEVLAEERGIPVVEAFLQWGRWRLSQQARGARLVCGVAMDMDLTLAGPTKTTERRFILCEHPGGWVWTITDGINWWEVHTAPGLAGHEQCPSVVGLPPMES